MKVSTLFNSKRTDNAPNVIVMQAPEIDPAILRIAPRLPRKVLEEALAANMDLASYGWCTPKKAAALAQSIYDIRPNLVVEIGIFGGRSLLPIAVSMKYLGQGVVYGIEPWSNSVAVEVPTNPTNDEWWSTVDLNAVKRACFEHLLKYDVIGQAKILECRSTEAFMFLNGKIDMIHVDGNHSAEQALDDVKIAYNAVMSRGHIWMDDIRWESVKPAMRFLYDNCETVCEYDEPGCAYGLYRKKC
ncbi:MAG: class I SAM-dependent methyltransferase [Pirellulales bacterium]